MSVRSLLRRSFLVCAGRSAAACALGAPLAGFAQPLPDIVRLLVGLPPGSLPDAIARTLEHALAGRLARSVIVESRPGAAGRIAVDVLMQGGGDGNTLMVTPSGVVTLVSHTFCKLSYRPFSDLMPVTMLAYAPFMFAIGPLVDEYVRTMPEFARWCQANPAKASFATLAAGSPPHFVGEVLKQQFRYECSHVPWRTSPLPDVLGGQIAAMMGGPTAFIPFAHDKRLRVLGTTGKERFRLMPDVPTFAEQGAQGLDWWDWYALYASAKAPAEVVRRHALVIRQAMAEPAVIEHWRSLAKVDPVSSSSEELDHIAHADDARWAEIVRSTGFVAE